MKKPKITKETVDVTVKVRLVYESKGGRSAAIRNVRDRLAGIEGGSGDYSYETTSARIMRK